jgi:hypothetical protein
MSRLVISLLAVLVPLNAAAAGAADAGVLPAGWFFVESEPAQFGVGSLPTSKCGDGPAAELHSLVPAPTGTGSVMQRFRAQKYRGMRLRFSAAVSTKDVQGWAGLWMRIDGTDKKTLGFDNMQTRPLRGTTTCAHPSVVLDVPQQAEVIALGLVLEGAGSAQLSRVELEPVDESVPVTTIAQEAVDPRWEGALGRVSSVWFNDRMVNRLFGYGEVRLVSPGRWSDRSGDFGGEVDGDRVLAHALILTEVSPLAVSGEFRLRREGDVNVIEGTWGSVLKKYPVLIRYSRQAVDMKWGFYERHMKVEYAAQLASGCVFYAQWASPSRMSDQLQLCGVVFDSSPPPVQTVLAFLITGFRRMDTGIPLDHPSKPPVLPNPNAPPPR